MTKKEKPMSRHWMCSLARILRLHSWAHPADAKCIRCQKNIASLCRPTQQGKDLPGKPLPARFALAAPWFAIFWRRIK